MCAAVIVRGAFKKYAFQNVPVLDYLDMEVPQGSIYGLLGASGCGKTTLLSCVVGTKKLNGGSIWVLGNRRKCKNAPTMGSLLGYMPQDIALIGELSIKDCAMYFGWIYGMDRKEILKKFRFLETLLELPKGDKFVRNLSGGQQRRASLAIALIHMPEILILDEPTVGLDPVLRQNIWDYLLHLTVDHHKTIIITTHYIEEARQAHVIGLMRNGRLLEEGCPDGLLTKYNANTIEQVFLQLCSSQDRCQGLPVTYKSYKSNKCRQDVMSNNTKDNEFYYSPPYRSTSVNRLRALIWKNFLRVIRHPGGLMFTFLLPIFEIALFFLTVGGEPQNLRFGIVNEEMGNFTSCNDFKTLIKRNVDQCDFSGLSCMFLTDLFDSPESKYLYEYFPNVEEAKIEAQKGNFVGVIHFGKNFTLALKERLWANPDDTESSEIQLWLDMTDGQTAILVQRKLYDSYLKFSNAILTYCGLNSKIGTIPIEFYPPIYGTIDANYGNFAAPGCIVTLIFFLAVTVTSIIIIVERDEGVWSRSLVAGVSTNEVLFSHLLTQGLVMMLQTAEVMFVSFFVFGIPCRGNIFTLIILLLMQGLCGMSAGFAISLWCDSVISSNYVSMGSFVPIIFLSGSIWPIEGMPNWLQTIALGSPTTLATQSVRSVMERGWSFFHPEVLLGYGVSLTWITFLFAFSGIMLRFKGI